MFGNEEQGCYWFVTGEDAGWETVRCLRERRRAPVDATEQTREGLLHGRSVSSGFERGLSTKDSDLGRGLGFK